LGFALAFADRVAPDVPLEEPAELPALEPDWLKPPLRLTELRLLPLKREAPDTRDPPLPPLSLRRKARRTV